MSHKLHEQEEIIREEDAVPSAPVSEFAPAPASVSFTLSPSAAILIGSVVIAGAIFFTRSPQAPAQRAAVDVNAPAAPINISIRPVSAKDHIVGSPNAPIVLVEYSDFECPFCSVIYPTLKKIVADSNGQIAWVYRNLPLPPSMHPEARPAAEAAECVAAELGNNAYWKFSDAVFSNQQGMGTAFYHKTAVSLGADPDTFDNCVAKQTYDQRIVDDATEANNNGGSGTPYTIIVGKKGTPVPFSGALPEAQILSKIKQVQAQQ